VLGETKDAANLLAGKPTRRLNGFAVETSTRGRGTTFRYSLYAITGGLTGATSAQSPSVAPPAEADRRRKAGEGFDRLAREMKVSRGTVLRAYDSANRNEAAAAALEGRKPTRPPSKWSEESRAAKRKPRGA